MYEITRLVEDLKMSFGLDVNISQCETFIYCDKENIVQLMGILKEELKFMMLSGVTAVDYGDYFEVVYHVTEDKANLLKIKVKLDSNNTEVPSIISIWKSAGVQEREVYDLMGITFLDHGDLKRVLCTDDFEGHPLRKDFVLNTAKRF